MSATLIAFLYAALSQQMPCILGRLSAARLPVVELDRLANHAVIIPLQK